MPIVNSSLLGVTNVKRSLRRAALVALGVLLSQGVTAQPQLSAPCSSSPSTPCRPELIEGGVQKSPSVFYLQARVSPAKLPSGRGSVPIFVNISREDGEVLCQEKYSKPVKIRRGVLNLEIGRGMDCALDEVFAENSALRVQLCLGSPDSCMRPIELTAVPFALSAHLATEVRNARRVTLTARADVTHRVTADSDVIRPSAVGYGYFDFFTPTPTQLEAFDALPTSSRDGFMLWTPVRGAEEGEVFPANQLLFVGEDSQGELATLGAAHLLAVETQVTGRAEVKSGHVVVRGRAEVQGEARVARRLSAPKLKVKADGLRVTGDSVLIDDLSAVNGATTIRGDATLRAEVSAPSAQVGGVMSARQARASMGLVEARGPVSVHVDQRLELGGDLSVAGEATERADAPPLRQGLAVSRATRVEGGVTLYGSTTVTRRLDPNLPHASGAQGLSMQSEGGEPRRVFSIRENGVIELNRPEDSAAEPIGEISIKARKVTFEGEASFQDGRLGSECTLVPEEQKLVLVCGDQRLSFAPDQCGNGRRFRCSCGDGNQDASEECDDGNDNNLDACLKTCTAARCGDRLAREDITDPSQAGYEECDDGNDDNLDACLDTCLEASCGDGFLRQDLALHEQGYEECDDGDEDGSDECTNACTVARCGDNFLRVGPERGEEGYEECDDGNLSPGDGCDEGCIREVCGNQILQAGEACDDGNADNQDACVNCQPARCGDSFVRRGHELCDDGNQNRDDSCVDCRPATCGDGEVWAGVESCDDGNRYEYDVCRANCTLHCNQIDKVAHFVDQSGSVEVTTSGRRSSATSAGGGGPQAAVGVTLSQRQTVVFESTSQNYDAYYHLRRGCDDVGHVAYDDDSGGNLRPRIERTLDAGTYYLIVDGYNRYSGTSTLNVSMLGCSGIPVVDEINLVYGHIWGWFYFNGFAAGQLHVNTTGGERVNRSFCGGSGPQKAVVFTLTRTSNVRFTTISSVDPVLHIRNSVSCHNPQDIVCNDDGGPGLNSELRATLAAGTYYLIVDGYGGRSGQVTIDYEIY